MAVKISQAAGVQKFFAGASGLGNDQGSQRVRKSAGMKGRALARRFVGKGKPRRT